MIYKTGIIRSPYTISIAMNAMMMATLFHWEQYIMNTPKQKGRLAWYVEWGSISGGICGVSGSGYVAGWHSEDPAFWTQRAISAWFGDTGAGQSGLQSWTGTVMTDLGPDAPSQDYGQGSQDCGGTASFTVDAELCIEYDVVDGVDTAGSFAPSYGGTVSPPQAPPYHNARFFWRAVPGATFTVSVTSAGHTVTTTRVIGSGETLILPEHCTLMAYSKVELDLSHSVTQDCGLSVTMDGVSIVGDDHVETRSSGRLVSAVGGILARSGFWTLTGYSEVTGFLTGYKRREIDARFGVNAMNVAYPDALTFRAAMTGSYDTPILSDVVISGGRGSASSTQRHFTLGWDFGGGDTGNHVVNEIGPFFAFLKGDSLNALGEDLDEWRTPIRGKQWDAWTSVSQDATYPIDGSFSGTTSITRTYSAEPVCGYRYLSIDTDQANKPIRVTLAGMVGDQSVSRQWEGTTDGSGVFVCDLCSPQNVSDATDPKDTRWIDVDDTITYAGPYWGLDSLSSMVLDNLEAGITYAVGADGVALVRTAHSLLHFAEPLKQGPENTSALWLHIQHVENEAGITTDTYIRCGMTGDTDGRRSADTWILEKIVVSGGGMSPVTSYVSRTVRSLLQDDLTAADNRNPGWHASLASGTDVSDGADYSDWSHGWINANRPAACLCGGGLMYASSAWSAEGVTGVSCNSAATVKAQELLDCITSWPGNIGDVFGVAGGGATGALVLAVGKVLRGGAWGLVTDSDGLPVGSQQVDLLQGATERGVGTTDSTLGEYATGTPFGKGQAAHTIRPHGAASYVACNPLRARRWRRACFRGPGGGPGELPAYRAIEVDSPRSWLHASDDNVIRTYHLADRTLAFSSGAWTSVNEFMKLRADHRRAVLWCLGRQGTLEPYTYRLFASYDGGCTGTEVLSVTARTAVVERDSERGLVIVLWENSANVKQQRSLDGGATWTSATDAKLGGSSFAAQLLDCTMDPRRGNLLAAIDVSGTKSIIESRDLGETFATVLS